MKILKIITAVILSASTVFMTGCWNYREIESLAIVAGMGIDRSDNGSGYKLTIDLVDMTSAQTSGGGSSTKSKILETEGKTIFDAIRNAINICGKRLFFSDCSIIVISRQIAQSGIKPVLDFFSRDAEFRRDMKLLVSDEKNASEIFKTTPMSNSIISYEIDNMLKSDQKSLSANPSVKLYEALNLLSGEGISLTLPCIKLSNENPDSIQICATSVFKGEKMIGCITNETDAKYIQMINNETKAGILILDYHQGGKRIAIEIFSNDTSVTPVISKNDITMNIKVKMKAAIGENETTMQLSSDTDLSKVKHLAESTIENHIGRIIRIVEAQYDSDIFGFGNEIYMKDTSVWKSIKPKWDKKFKSVGYKVEATVDMLNTAVKHSDTNAGK